MPRPYPNNLKHHRRKKNLQQKEMRKFCQRENSSSITVYENGDRLPDLETALTYSIVLGVPIKKLVPLYYDNLCARVSKCADQLKGSLKDTQESYLKKSKMELLQELTNRIGCLQDINDEEKK